MTIAPYPYPGGKSNAAAIVWCALARVNSYIEPFCGSAAVFLARPKKLRFETLNDASGHVVNFLRATRQDPETVALYTRHPRSEIELCAAGKWLLSLDLSRRLRDGITYCDVQAAGVWAWYLSASIGPRVTANEHQQPRLIRQGVLGERRAPRMSEILCDIRDRLADARLLCGDWKSSLGPANHQDPWHTDPVGVFLDPPYKGFEFYNDGAVGVAEDVRLWCLEHTTDPSYRIVLCGYSGEHEMPGWHAVPWQTRGRVSKKRQEILWVSPTC